MGGGIWEQDFGERDLGTGFWGVGFARQDLGEREWEQDLGSGICGTGFGESLHPSLPQFPHARPQTGSFWGPLPTGSSREKGANSQGEIPAGSRDRVPAGIRLWDHGFVGSRVPRRSQRNPHLVPGSGISLGISPEDSAASDSRRDPQQLQRFPWEGGKILRGLWKFGSCRSFSKAWERLGMGSRLGLDPSSSGWESMEAE